MAKNDTTSSATKTSGKKTATAPGYESRLLVYPRRRVELALVCLVIFGIFLFLLMRHGSAPLSWVSLTLPIAIIGLAFLILPPTEEWEYVPWQNTARKVEQNFQDN